MKIVTAENGNKTVKISKSEWETIGKKHGWMKKTAATQIPAGNFSIDVGQANDARGMDSPMVKGLSFQFKGEQWSVPRNSWGEMESMLQDIEQSFANEIQQASGTKNQQAQQNINPQQTM